MVGGLSHGLEGFLFLVEGPDYSNLTLGHSLKS